MTDTEAKAPTDTLIARLESADGPDRELDAMIQHRITSGVGCGAAQDAPRYTASIDAALTLVPDEYLLGILAELENGRWTTKLLNRREIAGLLPESGPTPALALCIAALRAQQKDINA